MAVIETWFEQDLQKAVQVQHLDGSLFSNNANGNRIGVVVYNNGVAASLSGTVSGYAVLPDGTTVPCTGYLSGNRASVLIPAAAYQPGIIFVSVFLTSGSTVTTLAAVAANVQQARTDSQVSPGSAVTDWTQTINAAMQSVVTANAANMAVEYGSLTYPVPVGKYTIYNDLLYRCTTPIATAESWTASHWTRVRIADEVSDLKSALVTPYDAKTVNLSGKEIIVGLELYNADITKIYGFSVIRALQTGAVIIRVQKRNSDNTGWDSAVGTLCEYNVNNFDFSASKYKIVKVELEEKNNSGMHGYAYINVDTSTSVDLVGNPIDAVRINPMCFVDDTLNEEVIESLYPYDVGTKQDSGMNIIVGVELNGTINPSKIYGFSVIRALQTGTVIIRVQQMKDDLSSWDNTVNTLCEYNVSNFDFSSGLYGIKKVKLEERNNSGISGYAYLLVDTTTNVDLVNISYTKSRINPRYLNITKSEEGLSLEMIMPSSVYVGTGYSHIFYPSQMIAQQELADLSTVLMYASMNNAYGGTYIDGKKIGTVYPNANGDQSIKIHIGNVTNDAEYIESDEKDVTVRTIQTPTNKTASILVIGDSFMDFPWITSSDASPGHNGRGILAQVDEFAERSSNVFTWIGTHTSYTTPDNKVYKTEAYGGWNESYFIGSSTYPYEGSNIPSPFYIDGVTCNFAKYFENNGTPDIVIFFLGMNGGSGSGISTMISAIHEVSSSIKCIVCMVPPYFGERYNVNFYAGNSGRMQQNKNYISLFDGKESQNISLIPIHAMFHKTLHYIWTDIPMTAYGDQSDAVKVCTNHHPNPDGAKTLARIIYQYICRWL